MGNIQIDLDLECCLEGYTFSYVHILHRYRKHDRIKLQVQLYISVPIVVFDHREMHDVELKIELDIRMNHM